MVDVSDKKVTQRLAVACAVITFNPKTYKIFCRKGSPKGDVLEAAKLSGILAAKLTPQLIPHCHPLELSKVQIGFELNDTQSSVKVISEVSYRGQTGVEMEALAAATTACLTIYDMMKWADKSMVISEVKLLRKSGGKSGRYVRKN